MPPRILLFQARNHDDVAKLEERQSFADKAGLDIEHIVVFDLPGAGHDVGTLFECRIDIAAPTTYRRGICRDSRKSWICCEKSWPTVIRPLPLVSAFN